MGAKRSRGRPKLTVPTVATNSTPAASQSEATSEKHVDDEKLNISQDGKATQGVNVETLTKTKEEPEQRRLWVDVINDNRNPAKGRTIEYIAPMVTDGKIEVEINDDDVISELQLWENALILYVLGADLSMHAIKNFMQKVWNFVQLPDLYYHDEGYFILRFKDSEDMDSVLMKGPYSIRGMHVRIKEWNPEFNLKKDLMRTIPIWIKLPMLPLQLWGASSLNKIGSALGTPLVTDECTNHKLTVSYSRILVEVDITKKLPNEITIKDSRGQKKKQVVEYEWRPKYCDMCQQVGHQCAEKPRVKQWKPKMPEEKKSEPIIELMHTPKEPSIEVMTTPKDSHKESAEAVEEKEWTKVQKAARDKGKGHLFPETSQQLNCLNGFDALGALIDHHVAAEIIILLETRVKKSNAKTIREKLHWKGSFIDNYDHHANGRIRLYWDNNKVDIQHVSSSEQYIHCGVYDMMGGFKFWLTAIYALNQLEHRKRLWRKKINLQKQFKGSWCAVGDYNNVANANGRIGGKMVVEAEYMDYNDMLRITGLCEMDSKGDFFTWSNKQCANPIYSRIDRIIANVEWLQDNGNLQLNVLSPHISDHSLLYLSDPIRPRQRKRPFRFCNSWTSIEGFQEAVKVSWTKPMTGRPMEVLWKKLARLQPVLRTLNKPMTDMHMKIAEARNKLELAYNDLRNHQMEAHIMERIKICTEDLIKWNDMEATSLMQRTKINWIKMGDENNTYFQAYLKARDNTKSIQYLQKEDGSTVTSQ
ncbi:uncharacterized protein LOC131630653 [Vicia villosa]|uniref:uncharacterized protein LOC131630653 n=1 Tax=Vicia villosa TaxID=3911 RepID=UPI00273C13A3|nr:uncharacterized protein LOC131630653 [Vicia villosa]